MTEPPEEIRRLAEERARLRADRDFEAADAFRDRIRRSGWEVVDRLEGSDLVPVPPPEPARLPPSTEREFQGPADLDWSIHWLDQGWPEDVLRGIASFRSVEGSRRVQHIVVESVPAPAGTWPGDADVLPLTEDPGFAVARNMGLVRSRGRLVLVADASVEATGDVLGPLEDALRDPSVGVAGSHGVVTEDLREFRASADLEVDAIEGYLMAFRRQVLEGGVLFHRRYRFYRAADIDLSFQVRALGYRAVRVDLPIRLHEHRAWAFTPPDRREALSKRNMYLFLDRFRGRTDLLVGRGPGA